jgi:hypothetical protein
MSEGDVFASAVGKQRAKQKSLLLQTKKMKAASTNLDTTIAQ